MLHKSYIKVTFLATKKGENGYQMGICFFRDESFIQKYASFTSLQLAHFQLFTLLCPPRDSNPRPAD